MDDRALMQMALDAFEAMISEGWSYCGPERTSKAQTSCYEATLALRERLEQPEPEAVAWIWKDGTLTSDPDFADGTWTPLFAAPPKREWVNLTDEDIADLHTEWAKGNLWDGWNYERAIEAKLREKNACIK
jgi:hypothetical protein